MQLIKEYHIDPINVKGLNYMSSLQKDIGLLQTQELKGNLGAI